MRALSSEHGFRRGGPVSLLLGVAAGFLLQPASPIGAQSDVPGIPVGRWIIAPSLTTDFEANSNVNRSPFEETSDRIGKLSAEIEALLPFRNSGLAIHYEASQSDYEKQNYSRETYQELEVDLNLQFVSGDRVRFRGLMSRDFTQLREETVVDDPDFDGEDSFQGEPINQNRWWIEFGRENPGSWGYLVRLNRADFIHKGDSEVGFKESRGFDHDFEYQQPLSSNRSLVVYYNSKRMDRYNPNEVGPEDGPRVHEVGVPEGRESADTLQVGLRGYLGEGQPFLARLGYGRFKYEPGSAFGSDFETSRVEGLEGYLRWSLVLGDRSRLNFSLGREPLPSNFDTYYIKDELRSDLNWKWSRHGRLELGLSVAGNRYGEDVFDSPTQPGNPDAEDDPNLGIFCRGHIRSDLRSSFWARSSWRLHPRLRIEVTLDNQSRSSNCDNVDYNSTGGKVGLRLGWF